MQAKKAPKASITKKEKLLHRVEDLHEFNPMLGHRGCRLGIVYPEITRMQTRAIIEAACDLAKKGKKVIPEIMVPLVGIKKELQNQKDLITATAEEVMKKKGVKIDYMIGTMIELPRAAVIADEIAKEAEFFSFGTNDLTQTTFGFSRDDAGKFINYYTENNILEKDPFQTLDQEGVGQLVKMGVTKGRATRPNLKVGICGEHGGDPASVEFCYKAGLNYVSCSPYRVPIARLAAAHAKLKEKGVGGSGTK
jgi:pyruvate,orthophosphate dikinase